MSNNDNKRCASTSINCDKTIYGKFPKTTENTHLFAWRFFRI